jgi:hypothetical protein
VKGYQTAQGEQTETTECQEVFAHVIGNERVREKCIVSVERIKVKNDHHYKKVRLENWREVTFGTFEPIA